MAHEQTEKEVARKSAMFYLPITLGMALLFLLAASVLGSYPLVAKIGGAVWVGLLSLIVAMPVVTSQVRRQFQKRGA